MVISEKGYTTTIIKLSKSKCDKGYILRYKKIIYKNIFCILVETIEVLFMKIFFASKDMRFPYTSI